MQNVSNSSVEQPTDSTVVDGGENPEVSKGSSVEENPEIKQGQFKPDGDWVKYENYRKKLNENARLKEKYDALVAEREQENRLKLEEKQNFKALYENEKKNNEELRARIRELESLIENAFKHDAVSKVLEENGLRCADQKALFKLGNSELLQMVGENVEGVEAFIEDSRKRLPYLFETQKIPRTNDIPPTFIPGKTGIQSTEAFNKLPKEEQSRILKEIGSNPQR